MLARYSSSHQTLCAFILVFFLRWIASHRNGISNCHCEKKQFFLFSNVFFKLMFPLYIFGNSGRCRSLFTILTSIWFMPHDTAWDFLTATWFYFISFGLYWYDITLFIRLFLYTLIINVLLVVSIPFFVILYLYSLSLSRPRRREHQENH